MADEVEVGMLASTLREHMEECGTLQRKTASKLDELTNGLKRVTDKFDSIDKLTKWAWRGVGSIVLAVISAAVAVGVQNYMLHEQTRGAAVEAAQTASSSADTANMTLAETRLLASKIDDLTKRPKD